jgi:guanylate kinase
MKPQVICLIGPSASGKTAICQELLDNYPQYCRVRTATTRKQRPNESDDAYFFIDHEQFEKGKKDGSFLETSQYAGEQYGTPRMSVDAIIESGKVAVVPIEINGAMAYRELYGDLVCLVFVYRDKRTLIEAIMERDIPMAEKSKRIVQLDEELNSISLCDRCVINNKTIADAAKTINDFVA